MSTDAGEAACVITGILILCLYLVDQVKVNLFLSNDFGTKQHKVPSLTPQLDLADCGESEDKEHFPFDESSRSRCRSWESLI